MRLSLTKIISMELYVGIIFGGQKCVKMLICLLFKWCFKTNVRMFLIREKQKICNVSDTSEWLQHLTLSPPPKKKPHQQLNSSFFRQTPTKIWSYRKRSVPAWVCLRWEPWCSMRRWVPLNRTSTRGFGLPRRSPENIQQSCFSADTTNILFWCVFLSFVSMKMDFNVYRQRFILHDSTLSITCLAQL